MVNHKVSPYRGVNISSQIHVSTPPFQSFHPPRRSPNNLLHPPARHSQPPPAPCNSNTNNNRAYRHRIPKTTRLRGRQSPGSRPSCCNGRASRGPCGYPIRTSRRNRNPISARAAWQKHGWLLVSARLCYSRRRFLRRRWERQSDVLDGLFWVGFEMEAGHVSWGWEEIEARSCCRAA